MKRILVTIGGAALVLLVLRSLLVHQVDSVKLESLNGSMGEREVEAILGKPTSVVTNDSFWTSWRYDRVRGVYCEVILTFDSHGRYRGRFHDTLEMRK